MRRQDSRQRTGIAAGLFLAALALSACSEQAKARRELRRQGIPFTPAELTARAKSQDAPVVATLLRAGLAEDRAACTVALCVAARLPDPSVVTLLAEAGADVATTQGSLEGYPVLMQAADAGRARNVTALAKAGADPSATAGLREFAVTSLHLAIAHGDLPTVQALLAAGASTAASADWMGDRVTPLHLAAAKGDLAIIDALLAGGADPRARSRKGLTPAEAARDNGKDAAAAHLASRG